MEHKIISVPVHKTLHVFYIRCMKTSYRTVTCASQHYILKH